jgi:ATP-dependent helicase/nuclease subunit B
MTKPFLRLVAEHIFDAHKDSVEKLCIVLPGKRGALFLKKHLSDVFQCSIWAPRIITTEELIAELSGLTVLQEIDLICHLYESYKACFSENAETFESFAKWGQLILQDFNEIDRYLADPAAIYENLKEIKVIENWSLGSDHLTEHQTNYLHFMGMIASIYRHYTGFLLSNGWGYQGLAYRKAAESPGLSGLPDKYHKIIFCGFNALNPAEIRIMKAFEKKRKLEVLWDADKYYLEDENQEAGLFLRENISVFGDKKKFIGDGLVSPKKIKIVSVPKQMGQAQVVKQTLDSLISDDIPLEKVAVVLANEKLLWPILQQLPPQLRHLNVTMEYPLRYTSAYNFLDQLINIQISYQKQNRTNKTLYHADLVDVLRQPLFGLLLKGKQLKLNPSLLMRQINARNLSFLSATDLRLLMGEENFPVLHLLVESRSTRELCRNLKEVLLDCQNALRESVPTNIQSLELEYLNVLQKEMNRLSDILEKYLHFNDILSFRQLFVQVIGSSTAPFIGEPLSGLQIMGVLETRTLDFEYLIFVNVNEGILPSGKTVNSFIPNDLKRAFGLPLYQEKDAVYAYHFYRLLQRANDIVITYDSETDTFGKGEKSRFLTQLQLELTDRNKGATIVEMVANNKEFPQPLKNLISIPKSSGVLSSILEKARRNETYGGLSPSSLISFKQCPLQFYFRYETGLKEAAAVEENAEANTFGSILHLSLESMYRSLIGKKIEISDLTLLAPETGSYVEHSFLSFFDNRLPSGKALLQQEVLKVYVQKLFDSDLKLVRKLSAENKGLTLLGLETEYSAPIGIVVDGKVIEHYVRGKIDRVDKYGDVIRVIDYKSSVKDSDRFIFDGFENLFLDKNYNKLLQLFIYAWLLYKNDVASPHSVRPCVIPFKIYTDEPKYILDPSKKILQFTTELLDNFEKELSVFISSIFDPALTFEQTNDPKVHEFCPYRIICNFNS